MRGKRGRVIDRLLDLAATLAGQPWLLAAALFAFTLLLEDAAAIAAGLLAAAEAIDPYLALGAVVAGTVAGDLGLYAAGRHFARTGWGGRLVARAQAHPAHARLRAHAWPAVAAARFVPGLRLPVFTLSGTLRLPFARFAAIVVGTIALWTPALFLLAMLLGRMSAEALGSWAWAPALLLLALALAAPRLIGRRPA